MDEWGVVVVVIALVGLVIAICGPVVKNTKAMTELTVSVRYLADKITALETSSGADNKKLWEHNQEQDKQIAEHDKRLLRLEVKQNERKD